MAKGSLTKVEKRAVSLETRLANIRRRAREESSTLMLVGTSAVAAFGAGYATERYEAVRDGIFGISGDLAIGTAVTTLALLGHLGSGPERQAALGLGIGAANAGLARMGAERGRKDADDEAARRR